jgi:hypothetical protein
MSVCEREREREREGVLGGTILSIRGRRWALVPRESNWNRHRPWGREEGEGGRK